MKHLPIFVLLTYFLASCTLLKSEFYREETKHLYQTGCIAYKEGNYSDAKKLYQHVIELDIDYGPAYAALGNIAIVEKDFEAAHAYYEKAIEYDPELKSQIFPLLFNSKIYKTNQPLIKAGVSLASIYPLIMADKQEELEILLAKPLPLALLAKDCLSITPGELAEIRAKVADTFANRSGSINYQLFTSYLLFHDDRHDEQVVKRLLELIPVISMDDQQEANLVLGQLFLRSNHKDKALFHFLASLDAGNDIENVAPFLSQLLKLDEQALITSYKNNPVFSKDNSRVIQSFKSKKSEGTNLVVIPGEQEEELVGISKDNDSDILRLK